MPNLADLIDGFVAGDNLTVERAVLGIPVGGTLASAVFLVKREKSDVDIAALITKTITPTPSADGIIKDTGGTGTGVVSFTLTPADTATVSSPSYWECRVTLSNGAKYENNIGIIIGDTPLHLS